MNEKVHQLEEGYIRIEFCCITFFFRHSSPGNNQPKSGGGGRRKVPMSMITSVGWRIFLFQKMDRRANNDFELCMVTLKSCLYSSYDISMLFYSYYAPVPVV